MSDARDEAERRWPSAVAMFGLEHTTAARAFVAGAEWQASRTLDPNPDCCDACQIEGRTVTDAMADAAQVAYHEYAFGPGEPALTHRELGITRQGWKAAIAAALEVRS